MDLIHRGKYQPRRDIDQEALQELADSIKVQGVMQPIVLRPAGEGKYEIIAGERRWRATQLAGLDKIPAMVHDVPDEAAIAMALMAELDDVAISTGSACTSESVEPSYVLQALGLPREVSAGSIRIGFGRFTTQSEIDYAARRIAEEVAAQVSGQEAAE